MRLESQLELLAAERQAQERAPTVNGVMPQHDFATWDEGTPPAKTLLQPLVSAGVGGDWRSRFLLDNARPAILGDAEKQSGLSQLGGWQKQMARRRYQKGSIRKRGKRNPIYELQWWENYIQPNGTIGRRRESAILGYVGEMTLRQARKAAEERLRPTNEGKVVPQSSLTLRMFVDNFFVPLVFPALKPSTRKRYLSTLKVHLLPAFGERPLRDFGGADLQRFVIQKSQAGMSWAGCSNLRNILSKLFTSANKWDQGTGENPARPESNCRASSGFVQNTP